MTSVLLRVGDLDTEMYRGKMMWRYMKKTVIYRNQPCWHLDLEHLAPDFKEINFYCVNHPICHTLLMAALKNCKFSSSFVFWMPLTQLDLFREGTQKCGLKVFCFCRSSWQYRTNKPGLCLLQTEVEQGRQLPPHLSPPSCFCPKNKHINSFFSSSFSSASIFSPFINCQDPTGWHPILVHYPIWLSCITQGKYYQNDEK